MAVLPYAEKLIEAFDFEQEKWFVLTEKPGKSLFTVWLQRRLLSAGLESVLSLAEKSYIALNYRQFSTNIFFKS